MEGVMKKLFVMLLAAGLSAGALVACAQDDDKKDEEKKDKKAAEALLIKASAEEVAKDFAKDAKEAREKYTPKKAPKGVRAGTIVHVAGTVEHQQADGSLQMKTKDWTVTFKGPVEGTGPNATVNVTSVAVGVPPHRIVVLHGSITRSKKAD
jgi:hypothetical protein